MELEAGCYKRQLSASLSAQSDQMQSVHVKAWRGANKYQRDPVNFGCFFNVAIIGTARGGYINKRYPQGHLLIS